MRARYYNVEIKRFINQDVLLGVLERVSSLNRYAYVEGNPISYLDPFGLAIETVQKIVTVISTVVSALQLLQFIVPGSIDIIETCLSIITISLDLIQLYRYGADEKRVRALAGDITMAIYKKILPFANEKVSIFEKYFGTTKAAQKIHDVLNVAMDYLEDGVSNLIDIFVSIYNYDN